MILLHDSVSVGEGFTKWEIKEFLAAEVKGKQLVMQLGYSHPIEHSIPDGIDIVVDKKGVITVAGISKQRVGQCAAEIRGYRPPDHYKGKGVRYQGEHVRIKAGKSAG